MSMTLRKLCPEIRLREALLARWKELASRYETVKIPESPQPDLNLLPWGGKPRDTPAEGPLKLGEYNPRLAEDFRPHGLPPPQILLLRAGARRPRIACPEAGRGRTPRGAHRGGSRGHRFGAAALEFR